MHDRLVGAFQRLESAGDQFRTALDENLQRHVGGHITMLDAPAGEVEVGLRSRGETDLDFLEAHVQQQLEHARLAVMAHRIDERLIAVAQVDRTPDRRLGDDLGRPRPVGNIDLGIGAVFYRCVWHAFGGMAVRVHGLVSSFPVILSRVLADRMRLGDDKCGPFAGELSILG